MQKSILIRLTTITVAYAISALAYGDTNTQARSQNDDKLEQIVVTAQKRPERLIEVPQSVSLLSAADLEKQAVVEFSDLAGVVPGLNVVTYGPGKTTVSMRGVSIGGVGSTIGVYIDDVPYGSNSPFGGVGPNVDMALSEVSSMEVLRGPQGTLYGASTMGGLLKYATVEPDSSQFLGDLKLGSSTTSRGGVNYGGQVAANFPIVADKAALRVSGFGTHDAGVFDNLGLGRNNVDQADTYGGGLDLLLTPTDKLKVRLRGYLQDISAEGQSNSNYVLSSDGRTGVPVDGEFDQRRAIPEHYDQSFRLISANISYDMDWASLAAISSYQSSDQDEVADISYGYVPLLGFVFGRSYSAVGFVTDGELDKFAQEIRLSSKSGQRFEWVVGGYYTDEDSGAGQNLDLRDMAGNPAANDVFQYTRPAKYEEYAAFGDMTWRISSKFDVTGGIRYAENSMSYLQNGSGFFIGSTPLVEGSDNATTYLANARYHVNENAIAYIRYATGYRPGGANFVIFDPVTNLPVGPPAYEPDTLKSYELGFKSETDDGRFGFDVAAYYIDWSNIQVLVIRGGVGSYGNAVGGAEVRGGEASFSARLGRGLTIVGNVAYQDPRMREADPDLGAAKDEGLPLVSRYTAAMNLDYNMPFAMNLEPSFGATVRYVDERNTQFKSASESYVLPEYTSVDLRAGLQINKVTAQLYIRNVLDERGEVSFSGSIFGPRVSFIKARTFGINLATRF